jgi:hypothetical protein
MATSIAGIGAASTPFLESVSSSISGIEVLLYVDAAVLSAQRESSLKGQLFSMKHRAPEQVLWGIQVQKVTGTQVSKCMDLG